MSEQSSVIDSTAMPTTAGLVGEGKKFKTVEDLAKGKVQSDTFIEKLQIENKALREALESDVNPDEVLKRINTILQANTKEGSRTTDDGVRNQSTSTPLSEKEVLDILSKREREQQSSRNNQFYTEAITKAFGDKQGEIVSARLRDVGMDTGMFNTIVENNPNAALRILGVMPNLAGGGTSPDSSVNTAAFFGEAGKGNSEVRNFAYFTKLRHELGTAYYEPEIQKQVFEARKKMGPDFWK